MIKNLLFDLGGVIMDIRRQNCVDAFKRLGMPDPDRFLGEYSQKGPFKALEEGSITPAEFREEIRRLIPRHVTDSEIDDAFSDFLIGIPAERLRQLRELHEHYRLYLLSNTNPIMWHGRIAREFRKEGHDINYYFDGIVTSFEVKCLKPERKIFEAAARICNIVPEETIFFDDSKANLEAAAEVGFNTIWVAPGEEFYTLLANSPGIRR